MSNISDIDDIDIVSVHHFVNDFVDDFANNFVSTKENNSTNREYSTTRSRLIENKSVVLFGVYLRPFWVYLRPFCSTTSNMHTHRTSNMHTHRTLNMTTNLTMNTGLTTNVFPEMVRLRLNTIMPVVTVITVATVVQTFCSFFRRLATFDGFR